MGDKMKENNMQDEGMIGDKTEKMMTGTNCWVTKGGGKMKRNKVKGQLETIRKD